jgi:ADP-heptose:LPS heptosyltransferase
VIRENGKLGYTGSSAPYYGMSLLNSAPDGTHKAADGLKASNRQTYAELWLKILRLAMPDRAADLRPVLALGIKDRGAARRLAKRHGLKKGRPIGFNPGAGSRWPSKQISVERSAEILDALYERFRRPLILFGGKDEARRNRAIIQHAKSPVIDAGTGHGLREFAGLIDLCGLVIATDSLAFHVAAALGKPALVLVGPTSAAELDVFGRGKILTPPGGCSCFYRPQCRYETSCLDRLPVADILREAGAFLR